MDDEQSFAALLRSTTPASRPTWDAPAASGAVGGGASGLGGAGGMSADPWANPFASSPPQPFAAPSIPRLPAVPDLPSPSFGSMSMNSPYDAYTAGATQNSLGGQGGFGDDGTGVVDDAVAAFGGMSMARPSAASRIHVEDQKESPYVQQLEAEGVTGQTMSSGTQGEAFGAQVDPPSVIAAREQEALDAQHAFEHDQSAIAPSPEPTMEDDPFAQPFASPSRAFTSPIRPVSPPIPPFTLPSDSPPARATTQSSPIAPTPTATAPTAASPSKKLPAGLIDDDLLAASDPMLSLKKAFVKSTPAVSAADTAEGAAKGSKEADKGRSSPAPKARHVDRAKKTFVFSAGASKKPAEVKKTQPPSQTKSQPSQPHSLESKSAKEEDKAGVSVNGDQSGQEDAGAAATESDQTAETKHDARKTGDVPADDKGTDEGSAHGSKPAAVAPPEGKEQERKQPAVQPSLEPQTAESTDKTENAEPDASPTVPLGEKSQPASVKAAPSGAAHEEKPSTESLQTVLNGRTEAAEPVTEPNAAEPTSADNALSTSEKRRSLRPAAIPLPDSTLTSPGLSRQVSHVPDNTAATTTSQAETGPTPTIEASSSSPSRIITSPQPPSSLPDGSASAPTVQTPYDRVAVSPLDGPVRQASDFGFTPAPADTSVNYQRDDMVRDAAGGWDESPLSGTTPQGRFSAKGWGAVDDLFGRKDDPWGGDEDAQGDWQEAGPSTPAESEYREPAPAPAEAEPESAYLPESSTATPISARQSPVKPRRKTHPVFTIAIGDPTRVGDPVRGYTVYTIRTHTTSPHYRKSDLSALRRFSDFLWLVEALTANNPGIIIPPVPDKHTFGRFQEQFIETRRMALERSLTKITAHPVLQLDPDLRLFLESDNFALESKARRPALDTAPEQRGLLSGWTGPRFVESDDWFVSRGAFLDSLEAQLRGLSKAVEVSSKARLDYAIALGESAETMSRLAESDLGSAMCAALARLADLGRTEKEAAEELAKGDVVNLLNVADEYIRFIGSVRIAMQARTKGWFAWQSHVKEANRFKATREKMRAQGKLGDRAAQSLAEANELDRRAADAERDYETTSKVIKSEFARFERERVEEFKRALERWLDVQITRQKEVIEAWEEYHGVVLKMVHKAQGTRVPQPQH